jgi:hypothetical protein
MKGICRPKRPESQHVVKCSTRMRDIREWNRVRVSLVRRSNTFTHHERYDDVDYPAADCGRRSRCQVRNVRRIQWAEPLLPGDTRDSVMSTFSGLVTIVAPHFTAGIVIDCNRVKKAPPWLRYMECWTVEQLQKFVQDQHWKMMELERYVRLGDFAMSSTRTIEGSKRNAGVARAESRSDHASQGDGLMAKVLNGILLFSSIAAFVRGIMLAAASLLT